MMGQKVLLCCEFILKIMMHDNNHLKRSVRQWVRRAADLRLPAIGSVPCTSIGPVTSEDFQRSWKDTFLHFTMQIWVLRNMSDLQVYGQ